MKRERTKRKLDKPCACHAHRVNTWIKEERILNAKSVLKTPRVINPTEQLPVSRVIPVNLQNQAKPNVCPVIQENMERDAKSVMLVSIGVPQIQHRRVGTAQLAKPLCQESPNANHATLANMDLQKARARIAPQAFGTKTARAKRTASFVLTEKRKYIDLHF